MGIFARIKKAWYDSIIWETIDEDFYDELEESLIMADLGAAVAADAVKELRKFVYEKSIQRGDDVKQALRDILEKKLEVGDTSLDLSTTPSVVLIIGVNGVGKTTSIGKLANRYKKQGKRVLLCDFDPQANSTSGMGVDKTVSQGVYDVLINGADVKSAVVATRYGDVLPSNKALAGAGIEMIGIDNREALLKQALDALSPQYDYILIDCPPSLELLTVNALCAAQSLLVPVQCEYYALEGLSDLLATVRLVKRGLNPKLNLEGVLLTMFDGRTNLSLQVAEEVKRHFPGQVYATVIPRNVRLSEAPSHGKPVNAYDGSSRGSVAYQRLTEELLEHNPLPGKEG